ncbi:acetylglutamate kinase [Candidatus Margulisiibacteriota bacterium]
MYMHLIRRASTVVEVLPYLRKFRKKIIVIKYGGSAMVDEDIKDKVMQDIVLLNFVGMYPVIIHGGGKMITKKLEKKKIKTKFIKGFRQTSAEAINVVAKVLAKVNKDIVKQVKYHGGKAIGLTSKSKFIKAAKLELKGVDLGFVGEVDNIKKSKIFKALKDWKVPIISSIGVGANKKRYNINADGAAAEIASILKAKKLIFMTDVRGVLDKKSQLITAIDAKKIASLIKRKVVSGGMIPKVNYGLSAMRSGVDKVHIIDGRIPHALLLELFTDSGIGTMIEK